MPPATGPDVDNCWEAKPGPIGASGVATLDDSESHQPGRHHHPVRCDNDVTVDGVQAGLESVRRFSRGLPPVVSLIEIAAHPGQPSAPVVGTQGLDAPHPRTGRADEHRRPLSR